MWLGWGPMQGPGTCLLWSWWASELQDLEAPAKPREEQTPGQVTSLQGQSLTAQTLLKGDRTRASRCVGPGREEEKRSIKVPDEEGERASTQTAGWGAP